MTTTLEPAAPTPPTPPAPPPSRASRRRPRQGSTGVRWLLRTVAVVYVLGLVALPVLTVVRSTFADGFGPVWEVLTSDDFVSAVKLTLTVAGIATVINTVFGVGISLILVRYRFPGHRVLNVLIDVPLAISPIVVGISLILVYGTNGWFGGDLESAGFQVIFALPGMVVATVIVALPLVVREVVPTLEEAGTDQDQAAQSLGAGGWSVFRRITLPTIKWALAYGVVLSLARSLGEFGAVRVVSGSVAGESQTLTLFVNDSYQEFGPDAERAAFAAAFVLMMIAVLFIVLIALLRPKEKR